MALIKHSAAKTVSRDALVLDLGDLAREGERIRAEAKAEATRIIEEAKKERERIVSGAHEAGFEAGRVAGEAKGLEEGRTQGREDAHSERLSELEALERAWREVLTAFEASRESLLSEARREVIDLAVELASRVVKRTLEVDPGVAARQLEAVLRAASSPSACRVAVHPEDEAASRAVLPTLFETIESARHAEIVVDETLTRGSCVLKRPDGTGVDGSIEAQLERLVEAIRPAESRAETTPKKVMATKVSTKKRVTGPRGPIPPRREDLDEHPGAPGANAA